jgi:hypothetical protein
MILDKLLRFSDAQAITASAASTDVIDLGVLADYNVGYELEVLLLVTEAFTASGAGTLVTALEGSVDNSAWTVMAETAAIGKAALTAGSQIARWTLPGPIAGQANPRYFRINYTVATGPMTAGKVTAAILLDRPRNHAYPAGITVTN